MTLAKCRNGGTFRQAPRGRQTQPIFEYGQFVLSLDSRRVPAHGAVVGTCSDVPTRAEALPAAGLGVEPGAAYPFLWLINPGGDSPARRGR